MASDLLLDPQIRLWVVIPIILIAVCIELCRQYANVLVRSTKPPTQDIDKLREEQLLQRSRLLRANGHFLPPQAFQRRKHYLNHPEKGILTRAKEAFGDAPAPSPLSALGGGGQDPSSMAEPMKMQLINMIPMIGTATLVGHVFSGFVIIQVPFPLTVAFKPMLQRGVDLTTLSASWVSSMSFYFACTFGLRSIIMLFSSDPTATPDYNAMMMMPMMKPQQGPKKPGEAYEHEWDAVQVSRHEWALNKEEQNDGLPSASELATVEINLLNRWNEA